jgi:hypothetical protein
MDNLESEQFIERNVVALYDVSDCIKSWGRRAILGGGFFGFALGAALVAIPHTENVLTFGVVGTLIVGVVEGAVIAGAFAAFAAALYGKGVLRGKAARLDRMWSIGRPPTQPGWRDGDIPLSDWPARWAFPTPVAAIRSREK